MLFTGNFAPKGWYPCDGRLLPINSHQALFSLLMTTYGGDGQTNFGVPDLRLAIPVGAGQTNDRSATLRLGQIVPSLGLARENDAAKSYRNPALLGMGYYICAEGIYPTRD